MRLDYNILWIEDNDVWLETTKDLFEESISELGFRLNPTLLKDGDEIDELVIQDGFASFDLILVDYNLQNSQTGNDIIAKLRENEVFTDVLFYSQDISLVRNSIRDMGLEGVYTSDRTSIEDKFLIVVKTTIKKIQEVNTMRGLIMAETSILDSTSLDLITSFISQGTEASTLLINYIFECTGKSLSDRVADFDRYRESNNIEELLNNTLLFGAFLRAKALQRLGKIKGIDELNKFTENYNNEVIRIRNVFAHAKEVKENSKTTLVGSDEEFDNDRCIGIRKDLIKYNDLFDLIRQRVS